MPPKHPGRTEPEATEIKLSPMIDCIFILLIFFIVTTVFVEEPGVDIFEARRAARSTSKLEKNSIIIAISADNKIVYGGKRARRRRRRCAREASC